MRPDCPFGILYANIVARTDVDASDAVDLIVQAIQEEMGDQERRRRNNDSDASAFFSSSYVYLPLSLYYNYSFHLFNLFLYSALCTMLSSTSIYGSIDVRLGHRYDTTLDYMYSLISARFSSGLSCANVPSSAA